jgi:hypothetical protein
MDVNFQGTNPLWSVTNEQVGRWQYCQPANPDIEIGIVPWFWTGFIT